MRLENFSIDVKNPRHVAWWAGQFRISEAALLEAVAAVGDRAEAVSEYLEKLDRQRTAGHTAS